MLLQFTLASGVLVLVGAGYVPVPTATTTPAPTISVTPNPIVTYTTFTTTPGVTYTTTPFATANPPLYGKLYNAEAERAEKKSTASHAFVVPIWAYPLCAVVATLSCLTLVR